MPNLRSGLGVERVNVAERRGDVHDAVDDDRRRLERLFDLGGEDPGRMQMRDVAAVDLRVRIEARLIVVAVGVKEVRSVFGGAVQLLL
jgi:hypothetical protein